MENCPPKGLDIWANPNYYVVKEKYEKSFKAYLDLLNLNYSIYETVSGIYTGIVINEAAFELFRAPSRYHMIWIWRSNKEAVKIFSDFINLLEESSNGLGKT